MWEVLLGTAAANKAASIGVGLSVLLGSAGAAEMTGIGPAVRELVVPVAESESDAEETPLEELAASPEPIEVESEDADSDELSILEEDEDADDANNGGEHFISDAEDAPGNLTWHLRGGAFHLRGLLVDEGGLAVRTAGPDGGTVDLPIDPELISVHIPGANGNRPAADDEADEPASIEDYVGYLVSASGECSDPEAESEETECTVTELRVLGQAGQGDDDDDDASLTTEALDADEDADDADESDDSEESEDDESEDGDNRGRGRPDHAGPKLSEGSDS